ncbi:glucan biosynthesis protein [Dichotomicrobium thermohalophilum]|uniref:Glucans biosynthesis protein n=1 Tax=Dichotomicrobium thermohalophilum TaxID=933063 RepID=A0A397P8M9_9HYPH|nr:glucan biosynthesis protein [Dichotomicrobium thermohalophilum]RIA45442.1 glucans biosynthesis protein [Dichotomicrobium thermohalophilum]
MMKRREFLCGGLAGFALCGLGSVRSDQALADETTFDRTRLVERARRLAREPYRPRPTIPASALPEMTYSQYQRIAFKRSRRVWDDGETPFSVELFHPGLYYRRPVGMNIVEGSGIQRIAFDPSNFSYPETGLLARVADSGRAELGYVGFRVFHESDPARDIISFLGASYFRAVGRSMQYGLSARGLAVNTLDLGNEEFPDFTDFWIERPKPGSRTLTLHALLDSPSVTGAYSFGVRWHGGTEVDVVAVVFPRRRLDTLGYAATTSMFYAGENDWLDRRTFRAEAHDSDGLAMRRGNGEWIWRPLANPRVPRVSTFTDDNPKGFGLLQRDRSFDSYNDIGADYEDRPSLWIEPMGDWGRGRIELLELPTDDDIYDNIVAAWRPDRPAEAGTGHKLSYRMWWGDGAPSHLPWPGAVVATRIGRAGRPGAHGPGLKFVVDFAGGALASLGEKSRPRAEITASRGTVNIIEVVHVQETGHWRMEFDMIVPAQETIDLRGFLSLAGQALSETWLYRLDPADWAPLLAVDD